MAKRLTDSEKWDDPWFLEISNEHKLLWLFILDKCDYAGIWKVNKRLVNFSLNMMLDFDRFLEVAANRIKVLSSEKWFILKFLDFQYKGLTQENKIYARVLACLEKEGLNMGDISPINGGKRKEKDKDKVILEEKREKEPFGDEGLVLLTREECTKLYKKLGERRTAEIIIRLENYLGSKGRKYKSHYHTILSWAQNEKDSCGHDGLPKAKKEAKKSRNCDACDENGKLPDGKKCWCVA